ncbi:ABC transporter ATP-binding protein [Cohnella thailandensis]|uniref:ABC transporter ATP-binding protein n=1 Tax=Cohnella thailandensis TaxID=557557 RepID=A0A841T1G6_9BACL|nr:ABC transporter ATP-binding protein [Cohnella thailandensis]MBB6636899.1 ABC transporter ATP-binding protein [Cohnella thailandensis]MBP1973222.1 ABC-2 type transport system ATP-binding protein [Cohnella thailandensis]
MAERAGEKTVRSNRTDDPVAAIELLKVTRSFGSRKVLHEIDLAILRGELFGLLGPSGSGKTTLVKLIAGLDAPSGGSVLLLGERMPNRRVLGRVGYMAQSDALYSELTGKQNLEFFASLYGLSGARRTERIASVMKLVDLTEHLNKPVSAYSGGMKRRLSLAVSLLHEPELLLLDEPTVGIDPVLRQSIWTELLSLRDKGITIVLTTHVMDEADRCDRIGLIREGRLTAVDSPEGLKRASGASTIEEAFIVLGGGTRA